MNLVGLLFSYQGRINRAKYWIAALIYIVLLMFLVGFYVALPGLGFLIAIMIAYLVMVVSGFMVAIKRLHDRDKTGWWVLLFYGVPIVLSWFTLSTDGVLYAVLSVVSFVVSIWALVELGCLRGSIGPNQYGPDPVLQT